MSRKCPSCSPAQEAKGYCLDYRKLNAQLLTVPGNISSGAVTLLAIPKIDEKLAQLHLSKFVTSLDLRSGYYHLKFSPWTGHKSAFTTILGKYKFLRIPFGLAWGPQYFTAKSKSAQYI